MSNVGKRTAGWTTVALGDVVRHVKDKVDPEESGLRRYVAGDHMDTDDLHIRRWGEIGDGYLGPAFHMRFKPGHVLYGSRRTYLRKVAVPDFEGITANTTYVLEPKDPGVLLPELLPFIMQTESFNRHSVRESKGSVNPYVNFSDLAWYEFALPPIEEQRRIVLALAAIETALRSVFEAKRKLKVANAAVIDHYVDALRSQRTVPVSLASLSIGDPNYGINAPATGFDNRLPRYLRITDIDDEGRLSTDDNVSVNVDDPGPYRIMAGDLLFARTGNTVGKAYLASGDEGNIVFAGYLVRFSLNMDLVNPKYVFAYTQSTHYWNWVRAKSRIGAQPNINAKEFSEMPLWLPVDRAAQDVLVNLVERTRSAKQELEDRWAHLAAVKRMIVKASGFDANIGV